MSWCALIYFDELYREMHHYIYMIKFNTGQFYIGSRTSKLSPEQDTNYWGSPKTFKHLWEDASLEKTKHIIKVCKDAEEKRKVEPKLIKAAWEKYGDLCLNRNAAPIFHPEVCKKIGVKHRENGTGIFALTKEQRIENSRKAGIKTKDLGIGVHGLTKEQRMELGNKTKEKGLGIFALTKEQRIENSRMAGKKTKENGTGIFSLTKEERKKISSKTGKKMKELGLGIHALSREERQKNAKLAAQKCKDLGTGIFAFTKEQRIENSKKAGKVIAEKYAKEFVIKSPNGEIISGRNIRKFCRENNLSRSGMKNVLDGKQKSHKGWTLP